ncbi:neural Wiskott-Aldrich syndrome protein-like isoform X1 [Canis lupus familiaris]|uniref:neural Wiskott-Aldrich syndrome protein-like isoform X1 n=1 Tax=Canis lupus familiaris TaxID=9615 RepID=UPI0018F584E6|nr:neural Wiskott-Aldrich syndrome protein-like isoform X1 [Canis lupus familiaris]
MDPVSFAPTGVLKLEGLILSGNKESRRNFHAFSDIRKHSSKAPSLPGPRFGVVLPPAEGRLRFFPTFSVATKSPAGCRGRSPPPSSSRGPRAEHLPRRRPRAPAPPPPPR